MADLQTRRKEQGRGQVVLSSFQTLDELVELRLRSPDGRVHQEPASQRRNSRASHDLASFQSRMTV
jgi:hypothetical protein